MSSVDFEEEDNSEELLIEDEDQEEGENMQEEGDIDNIDEDEFENEEEEEEELDKEDGNDDIDVIEIKEENKKKEETVESDNNITVPFITKYEYPKILSIRAQQIAEGSPIFLENVDLKDKTPINIAELEFKHGKLNNFIIKRKLPNGKVENIRVSDLKFYEFY